MNVAPDLAVDDLVGDPWYSRLKEYLIASTGMNYYHDKDADLSRRIRRRMSDFRLEDCASYFSLLRDSGRGRAEMDALIAEITIGETYFFRHREHFDALREVVLPDLIAQNAGKRRLRIWCAGCADGAEPYSLSILLRRELADLVRGWEVSILGTDINRHDLEVAREGRYEQWSLRSTPDDVRGACFVEQGKAWTVAPEYKDGVSFQFHNLAEDQGRAQPAGASEFDPGFDLIVCRNVMIYFGEKLMRGVIRRFHDGLAPGSWLLVGPSEPNMTDFRSFRAVNAPGVTLYQKPCTPGTNLEAAAPFLVWQPAATPERSFDPPQVSVPENLPTLAALRRHEDNGEWADAACCGRELIERDPLNAAAHFCYGLALEQLGNRAEAERSLRRALYLDRRAALTHYHLGLLLRSSGESRQAERHFRNALDLLARTSGGENLAGGDGITVAGLRRLAQAQIESLHSEIAQREGMGARA
jgi:chemotaxis protein methyltransferase CheR